MNMTSNNVEAKAGTAFDFAKEINDQTIAVVKAAIASGTVQADKVADLIRSVHSAFAETYAAAGGVVSATEALASSVADTVSAQAAVVEVAATEQENVVAEAASKAPKAPKKKVYKSIFKDPYEAVEDEVVRCLIDGVGKKMLKRYVRAKYNLSWDEYLEMFNLPADYPSVAPKYSESKKEEALAIGLGSIIPKTPKALRELQELAANTSAPAMRRRRNREKSGTVEASRVAA
jgi:Predicted transcriptional regulator